jgi:hypothetical protein
LTNKSPFQQLTSPPNVTFVGSRRVQSYRAKAACLEHVDTPVLTRDGGRMNIGIYIETSGSSAVRLLMVEGCELIWTERIVALTRAVALEQAHHISRDIIAKAYPSVNPRPQAQQTAFPAYALSAAGV